MAFIPKEFREFNCETATNRELYDIYTRADSATKYKALVEMTKRLGETMITPNIVPEFRHWKLNGGGMDRY